MEPVKRQRRTSAEMAEARQKEAVVSEATKAPEKKKAGQPGKNLKRVYAKQQLIDHDLYKLEPANMLRNQSYNDANPIWEPVEHVHFFHTVDDRGRPQSLTNRVGNHAHQITIDEDGNAICGPPVKEIKYRKHGRTMTRFDILPYDNHTHDVTYRFSEQIKPKTPNMEFAKVQSAILEGQIKAESAKVPDVIDDEA